MQNEAMKICDSPYHTKEELDEAFNKLLEWQAGGPKDKDGKRPSQPWRIESPVRLAVTVVQEMNLRPDMRASRQAALAKIVAYKIISRTAHSIHIHRWTLGQVQYYLREKKKYSDYFADLVVKEWKELVKDDTDPAGHPLKSTASKAYDALQTPPDIKLLPREEGFFDGFLRLLHLDAGKKEAKAAPKGPLPAPAAQVPAENALPKEPIKPAADGALLEPIEIHKPAPEPIVPAAAVPAPQELAAAPKEPAAAAPKESVPAVAPAGAAPKEPAAAAPKVSVPAVAPAVAAPKEPAAAAPKEPAAAAAVPKESL